QRVRFLVGLLGCTSRNDGLFTTMKSGPSAMTEKGAAPFAQSVCVADKGPLISFRNVTRYYKMGERAVHALDGVSLQIGPKEFVAVSGPSGCGKSTLIHLLAGLEYPAEGE